MSALNPSFIPKSADHSFIPKSADHSFIPKSADHSFIPKSDDHSFIPKSADHSFIPKSADHPFIPKGGWNPAFSQKDRQQCTEYYLYILPIHGPLLAEMMSQMILYKQKFHLTYSEEQEQKIQALFSRYSFGSNINPKTVTKNNTV